MTITVSPKFQVVIPKKIRELMRLSAGAKFEVVAYDDRIELILLHPIKSMRGYTKGVDTTIIREKDRL